MDTSVQLNGAKRQSQRQTGARDTMLAAEHEAAEVLRRMRLKTHTEQRAGRHWLRWLFELLGLRASGWTTPNFEPKELKAIKRKAVHRPDLQ